MAQQQLSFREAITHCGRNLTNFKGRARRSELWWNFLFAINMHLLVKHISSPFNLPIGVIFPLRNIIFLGWMTAVTVRRFHDRGMNGTIVYMMAAFILLVDLTFPYSGLDAAIDTDDINIIRDFVVDNTYHIFALIINFVLDIIIFVVCVLDSKPKPNKYGISPKYGEEDAEETENA
ncbi:MAG: DUF805 domain-containing protein [Prevotellaceae bacterium]|nr:DUF805 domain-containing protein [Prevotellaceae bacterium]